MSSGKTTAENIADDIWNELNGRNGIDFYQFDDEIQEEIREAMIRLAQARIDEDYGDDCE